MKMLLWYRVGRTVFNRFHPDTCTPFSELRNSKHNLSEESMKKNHAVNRPTNQLPAYLPIIELTNRPLIRSANQPINNPTNQLTNQSIKQPTIFFVKNHNLFLNAIVAFQNDQSMDDTTICLVTIALSGAETKLFYSIKRQFVANNILFYATTVLINIHFVYRSAQKYQLLGDS